MGKAFGMTGLDHWQPASRAFACAATATAWLRRSLWLTLFLLGWAGSAQAVIPATQRAVLLNLYASTNGAAWTNNTGWNGAVGTECSWFRITCDATQSNVIYIWLDTNNLVGTLPSIDALTALQFFNVDSNQLTGPIPSLSGMTALAEFSVRQNQLTGSIPSLTGLTALASFFVNNNQLTGPIPSLSGLTNLAWFGVDINQLTGPIPSLSGLTALQGFSVENNQLTGPVPAPPSSLLAGQSGLCNNSLVSSGTPSIDAAWVTAQGSDWLACQNSIAPSAPTAVTATAGLSSATIAFTPGSIGSGSLVNYQVSCSCPSCPVFSPLPPSPPPTTGISSPITVLGLSAGASYLCQVQTVGTAGTSPWSVSSNPVTPLPASPPTCTLSAAPTTIAAGSSATLTASCNPAASSYAWSANTGLASTASSGSVSPTLTTSYTVTGSNAAGTGNTATATVTVTSSAPSTQVLSITLSGPGTGTVSSNPAGINCGATCSASFTSGTLVTLIAVPNSGSSFAGWSGACTGSGTCTLTLDAAKNLTASFTEAPGGLVLTVTRAGSTGTVTSNPAGIDCGVTCSDSFTAGANLVLTATAPADSSFAGWSGACTGTGTCTVTLDASKNVTASFTSAPTTAQLTVTAAGAGTGVVTSHPAGITCGTACSSSFSRGATLSLAATPAAGSRFSGWGGACAGSGTCTLTMDDAKNVTASFSPAPASYPLTVARSGTGTGTVTSSPAGIDCGATCSGNIARDSRLTLTASPAAGSTFTGWQGACSGTGTCTLTMDEARNVTATFRLVPFVATASSVITPTSATITSTISFAATDVGKSGVVFVTAWVPLSGLGALGITASASPSGLTALTAADSPAFVLVQLTASGWQQVVNGQLIPYASGVLGDQMAAQTILNNTDPARLPGAQFCLSYGTSAAEMNAAGRIQLVAILPEQAPGSASSGTCLINDMIVHLEEPAHDGTAAGVGNIRGWAVSPRPIQRIDLYIDGSLALTVPYGGTRSDVGATYATRYPGATNSGFSMAANFASLTAGSHTFMTLAVDNVGIAQEATAVFNVVRFPNSFIADPAEVSLHTASATMIDAQTFRLNNVLVQGVSYNLTLRWNTATQGFTLTSITALPGAVQAMALVPLDNAPAPASAGEMMVYLEEPAQGGSAAGVGNIRGWAVSPRPIQRMELYLDGILTLTVPYGGTRSDVGATYANYPGAANSGFSMAANFASLTAGSHTFMTRAVDSDGMVKEATAVFNVVRFPSSFIADPTAVSLQNASATVVDAHTFRLNNVRVQGVAYNLSLRWNTATQGFALVDIQ